MQTHQFFLGPHFYEAVEKPITQVSDIYGKSNMFARRSEIGKGRKKREFYFQIILSLLINFVDFSGDACMSTSFFAVWFFVSGTATSFTALSVSSVNSLPFVSVTPFSSDCLLRVLGCCCCCWSSASSFFKCYFYLS